MTWLRQTLLAVAVSYRHRLQKETWKTAVLALVILLGGGTFSFLSMWPPEVPACQRARAAADYPYEDFCYSGQLTVTNNTAGILTNHPVRIETTSLHYVNNQYMGPYALDLLVLDLTQEDVPLFTQDIGLNPAYWWVQVPTLAANSETTYTMYMGNPSGHRVNGFTANGNIGTYITTPDHADLDVTDDFLLTATAETTSSHATAAWFISHYNTVLADGYRVGTIDIAGTKYVRAQLDASTCDTAWVGYSTSGSPSGTMPTQIDVSFANPNVVIQLDGVTVNTCNTGLASVSAVVDAFQSGVVVTDMGGFTGRVHQVGVWGTYPSSPVTKIHWLLAPLAASGGIITETQAPTVGNGWTALGTILDQSGGSHTGTYHLVSSQTDIDTVVGPIFANFSLTGSLEITGRNLADVLGLPVGDPDLLIATPSPGDSSLPGAGLVEQFSIDTGQSLIALWAWWIGIVCIAAMVATAWLTKSALLGLAAPVVVIIFFAVANVSDYMLAIVWSLVGLGLWAMRMSNR